MDSGTLEEIGLVFVLQLLRPKANGQNSVAEKNYLFAIAFIHLWSLPGDTPKSLHFLNNIIAPSKISQSVRILHFL